VNSDGVDTTNALEQVGDLLLFIGAAANFIGQSTDFWSGVVGFLKALVWPAFLVYEILVTLSA
jgi:hypothetical protein